MKQNKIILLVIVFYSITKFSNLISLSELSASEINSSFQLTKGIEITLPFATSEYPSDEWGTYNANNAFDGDLKTSWVEGKEGDGTGEALIFTILPNTYAINIFPGYGVNNVFKSNNRVKKITLSFYAVALLYKYQQKKYEIQKFNLIKEITNQFYDEFKAQKIDIPKEVLENKKDEILCVATIDSVYKGKDPDTCIAEISFLSEKIININEINSSDIIDSYKRWLGDIPELVRIELDDIKYHNNYNLILIKKLEPAMVTARELITIDKQGIIISHLQLYTWNLIITDDIINYDQIAVDTIPYAGGGYGIGGVRRFLVIDTRGVINPPDIDYYKKLIETHLSKEIQLFQAIFDDNTKLALDLINQNVNINAHDISGSIPILEIAIIKNNLTVLKRLIEKGVKMTNKTLCTVVINNYEILEYLLKHGASPNEKFNILQYEEPVVNIAIENKDIKSIKLLIEYGLKWDQQSLELLKKYLPDNYTELIKMK